jgi:hypothetical protein
MIQRFQTLFLLLADVSIILLFFFSIAFLQSDTTFVCSKLYVYGTKNMLPGSVSPLSFIQALPMVFFAVILISLTTFAIVQYKSRPYQVKLINSAILFNILLVAGIFLVYIKILESKYNLYADYKGQYGIFFPLISLLFLFLARRGVIHDEKLVKAADRLR